MATTEQIAALRGHLGERIPAGGTEADTMFTDVELGTVVDSTPNEYAAALKGWEQKRAEWASLVNVTDGASSRALSDLMEHADTQIAYYTKRATNAPNYNRVRARIGKIVRSN